MRKAQGNNIFETNQSKNDNANVNCDYDYDPGKYKQRKIIALTLA